MAERAKVCRSVGVSVGTFFRTVVMVAVWGAATFLGVVGLGSQTSAEAQEGGPRLAVIRDAEIEHIIRTFARPIFEVAGIDPLAVTIVLVRDGTLNAFVAGGMNIFFHTGLLIESNDPSQLIGVIAHETGHISGGHLIRGDEAMENASAESILMMLLGGAAAAASGNPGAAAAVILGGSEMIRRNLMAFSRVQESSADQAAITYLDKAHLSGRGLLAFLEKLSSQELMPVDRQSSYTRTHPLTRERIDTMQAYVEKSPWSNAGLPPQFSELHQRMKAKLIGFIQPAAALRRYPPEDRSVFARYARAVAMYQQGDIKQSLLLVDELIAVEPKNPFFYELKGQILLENRRVSESLAPYRKAVALLPDSGLLRVSLAQALLETKNPGPVVVDEALRVLESAMDEERRSSMMWRLMATAWDRKNNPGMLAYSMAEEAMARGDLAMARMHAVRAQKLLPVGSPGWIRAEDICAQVKQCASPPSR
ncbi:Peptidase M48 [Azospirillaceae bacterium]